MPSLEEARKILADAGQSHVLAFWDRLDAPARESLLAQIGRIDFAAVAKLRGVLADAGAKAAPAAAAPMEPATVRREASRAVAWAVRDLSRPPAPQVISGVSRHPMASVSADM